MCRRVLFLILLIPAAASAALAEVELTPTLGVRFGGPVEWDGGESTVDASPSVGLILDIPLAHEKWIAVLWSHQRGDFSTPAGELEGDGDFELAIDYIHAGGVYRPGPDKKTQPFVMVSGGVTWVRPGSSDFDDALGLSMIVGGGAKFVISPRIGLRVEGRGLLTLTGISISGTCGGIGCDVRFQSGGIFQFEALGGVTFSF